MNPLKSKRKIDCRFVPSVAGIDLMQALNYIDLNDVDERFIYDNFTSSHLLYIKGGHPLLESVINKHISIDLGSMAIVKRLTAVVAEKVKWAGFYYQQTGNELPTNRGMTEEQIIESGFGWCNEQARVLCCFTQMCGMPSRLVFAGNTRCEYGHVLTEVLLPSGWMLVDQSSNFLFEVDGIPFRAYDISKNADIRRKFKSVYKNACQERIVSQLSLEYLTINFKMAVVDNPLDGFEILGFHNHFVI